jgi:AcrR family transcriptional regulator
MPRPEPSTSTRERIIEIARELFAERGYTGTTIADIARGLGTTTAALYYHFGSKAEILDAMLAEPMAAYARLADRGALRHRTHEDVLGGYVDFVAETRHVLPVVTADPTIRRMVDDRLPRKPQEMTAAIVATLAGSRPSRAAVIRAHAAFAVVKEATLAALGSGDALSPADRREIVAAALRALRRP